MSFVTIDEWEAAAAPGGRLRILTVDSGRSPDSPVMLFLHGAGQSSEWLNEAPHVMAHLSPPFQALQGRLVDVTVVAPQARDPPSAAWNWRPYVADIATQLATRYAGRRVVAAGFSRGGLGVLQLLALPSPVVSAWALVDPQPPSAEEDNNVMKAVDPSAAGWVRYGPQHPTIHAFGERLARVLPRDCVAYVDALHGALALRAFTGDRLDGQQNLYEHLGLRYGDPEEDELLRLNRETFAAEDHASAAEMAPLLDEDFRIARNTWQVQDKAQALDHIANDRSGRTRNVAGAHVQRWADRAIVTSRVTVREANGQSVGHFWNTKLFVKRNGTWRCSGWQVMRFSE